MRYRDVAIHLSVGFPGKGELIRQAPPIKQRIDLSEDVWLGRLDKETSDLVMDTCEPKAFGIPPSVAQEGHLYSLVRELPGNADIYSWDHDNELTGVVGVSRLIHPTSIGFEYAARVGYETDGVKEIFPTRLSGFGKKAFLSPNRVRDWLTEADASILRELVPNLRKHLPSRIHRALWHHEYASRTYYLDQRWTLVCTGLEALIHTDRKRSTAQFAVRVSRLAAELGISISEGEAVDAYDRRSKLAHGVSFLSTGPEPNPSHADIRTYDLLEDILAHAVLKGMRDKVFGDVFQDDAQIRKRWPI